MEDSELNQDINRTKLHRFIRLHDDLEILNDRLFAVNDRALSPVSTERIRMTNDSKLILHRLNSMKRVVKIHLEQLEKFLATQELNRSASPSKHSSVRTSTANLPVSEMVARISLHDYFSLRASISEPSRHLLFFSFRRDRPRFDEHCFRMRMHSSLFSCKPIDIYANISLVLNNCRRCRCNYPQFFRSKGEIDGRIDLCQQTGVVSFAAPPL